MPKKESERTMNLKLLLAISTSCITGYGTIIGYLPLEWPLKIISIIAAIFVYMIFIVKYYHISDYEEFKTNAKFYDNLNLIFYTKKFKRKIIIHNKNGTATNYVKYKVKNISNIPISQITRSVFFDGDLDSFILKVNNEKIEWNNIVKKSLKSDRFSGNQAYRLYIKFPGNLKKGEKAKIYLEFKTINIYPNAFIPDPDYYEYSLTRVTYPYDYFKLIIKLDKNAELKDYNLYNKGFEIKLNLLDIEDPLEKNRFDINHDKLYPEGDGSKKLIWKFDNPKIGNSYKLLFHCRTSN